MRGEFPWTDVVPEEDLLAFAGGRASMDRPIEVGERPALVVVDMTRAFVDSAYPTGAETGAAAVRANRRLLDAARASGIPVFFTKMYKDPEDVWRAPPAERGRWKKSQTTPADPLLPPGDVIVEELAPLEGEIVVHKQYKPSAFFGTALAAMLIYERVDTVIVTGMVTSGCVRATALDAFQHNFHVLIPHEACADRSQISHKVTLFDLHMKYADVASLAEVVEYVEGVAASRGTGAARLPASGAGAE